jgi:outer membrane protein
MQSVSTFFAFVITACLAVSISARADAETLHDALAAAYLNNPTLQAERAGLRASDEDVSQALSNWRPAIEINTSAGVEAFQTNSSTGTGRNQHRDPRSLSFSITQPLFRGGRTVAATREAESNVKAERARLASIEQVILLDAVVAYVNVLRNQAVFELNINNEQVLSRQAEATRNKFQVGEFTRTEVFQAESRLAVATADGIQAEGNLASSRATYLNVIGLAPLNLEQVVPPADLPLTEQDAVRVAITSSPDVIAAELDTVASSYNVDEVRGELLPTLGLEGTATTALDSSGEQTRTESYRAKLSLSVPLYQSGAVYARLRKAKQRASRFRLLVDVERRNATEAATSAWQALQSARAQIVAFQKGIEASSIALEGVQSEAEVGFRTVLDVFDAEQELLHARVELLRAQRDEVVVAYQLKMAMGELTAENLGLGVENYDPKVHYEEVRDKWFGGSSRGEFQIDDLPWHR